MYQGVLEHGKRFVIYRTFHNLTNNANLSIYCFLAQLEAFRLRQGRHPEKIFYQVDGGSENANKYLLAICELLVSAGIVREIVLTRLPVGHTHELRSHCSQLCNSLISYVCCMSAGY